MNVWGDFMIYIGLVLIIILLFLYCSLKVASWADEKEEYSFYTNDEKS